MIEFEVSRDPRLLEQYYALREQCFKQDLGLEEFDGSEEDKDRRGQILIAHIDGQVVGGFCWYLGTANQSCDTVCQDHGGYHEATRFYAGSDGTTPNCTAVLNALRLGTGIALLMERDIFSQAKTIATLDRLSGGRLMIGTGVGWNQEEFENVSRLPWGKRYAVMRETVAAMRAIWQNAEAEYHGQYVDFDPVWCEPKPLQKPCPPVIFGAMGPLGIRHAVEWADGWFPVDVALGDVAAAVNEFRNALREKGRDPAKVPITLSAMERPPLDTLKRYRDIGIERVLVGVSVDMWDKPDQVMPMIDSYAKLIPEISD